MFINSLFQFQCGERALILTLSVKKILIRIYDSIMVTLLYLYDGYNGTLKSELEVWKIARIVYIGLSFKGASF